MKEMGAITDFLIQYEEDGNDLFERIITDKVGLIFVSPKKNQRAWFEKKE